MKAVEIFFCGRILFLPALAAVGGFKDYAILADGPTLLFVSKTDSVKRFVGYLFTGGPFFPAIGGEK